MKFGPLPVREALGTTLAHGQTLGGHRYRKGQILDAEDIARLEADGVDNITVALFEDGDVDENTAARRLAEAAAGAGVRAGIAGTGRVNLFAECPGITLLDAATIDRINAIDEGITISTLRPYDRVENDQVAATVKIIPFAVSEAALSRAEEQARKAHGLVSVRSYRPRTVSVIQTELPGLKDKVVHKTEQVIRQRVEALEGVVAAPRRTKHSVEALSEEITDAVAAGAELILLIGASATVDRQDVIPAAIVAAGGEIDHFGMPVDPGNLTVLARLGDIPVLALPGSARSPRPGGNDIVLERLMADIPVSGRDMMAMGVGGLLKEIPSRPMPRRDAAPRRDTTGTSGGQFACIVLAAGQSRRMGKTNKLLISVEGKPMAQHAIDAARAAGCTPIVVVTGHAAEDVRSALSHDVIYVHNPDYADGLSTSLRTGIADLPETCDGVIVALGDMPRVTAAHLKALMNAHERDEGRLICVPTWNGKRGNPVLWDRRFFSDMATLGGDVGAKHLIGSNEDLVVEVHLDDDAILIDVDSPQALRELSERGVQVEEQD
jgi:molybdenum cofactor cytidylyltransferase